jgi:hypothetical protein
MSRGAERMRIAALVAALLLFFCRVVAQIQVALVEPDWLPPMHAWYSGLLPYPVLLPVQIVLLMWMSAVAYDHVRGGGFFWPDAPQVRTGLRWFAAVYAVAMAVRLLVALATGPGDAWSIGIIPVVFHWVLAAFVWLVSQAPQRRSAESSEPDAYGAYGDEELLERVHVNGRERILHVSATELVRLRRLLDA